MRLEELMVSARSFDEYVGSELVLEGHMSLERDPWLNKTNVKVSQTRLTLGTVSLHFYPNIQPLISGYNSTTTKTLRTPNYITW